MRAPAAGSSRERLGEGGSSTDQDNGRAAVHLAGRLSLELTEHAEWQFTERELEMIEACTSVTTRGETIACIYVRTQPGARYQTIDVLIYSLELYKVDEYVIDIILEVS